MNDLLLTRLSDFGEGGFFKENIYPYIFRDIDSSSWSLEEDLRQEICTPNYIPDFLFPIVIFRPELVLFARSHLYTILMQRKL